MLSTFAKRTAKNSTSSTNNSFIKNRLYFTKTKPTLFAHHAERGTSFGYNTLVSDMRAIPQMTNLGYPIIFDATHSVQQPGGLGITSGGQREFVPILSRAAVSIGISGLFIEVHEDPDKAPSDGPNMLKLSELESLLIKLIEIDKVAKT